MERDRLWGFTQPADLSLWFLADTYHVFIQGAPHVTHEDCGEGIGAGLKAYSLRCIPLTGTLVGATWFMLRSASLHVVVSEEIVFDSGDRDVCGKRRRVTGSL